MKTKPPRQPATRTLLAILAALAITVPSLPANTEPGILWDLSYFEEDYTDLNAAAVSPAGRIVAVGQGGVIRYSDDNGLNWTTPEPDVHLDLDDIIWDPGSARFVAVGGYQFESGIVLTSFDGANWQQISLGSAQQLHCVASSGSLIATMGNNGRCYSSPDTGSWSSTPMGITDDYYDVVWAGSQFVRVGGDGLIETSPDAVTWTPRVSGTTGNLYAIAWSGSMFVAVGYDDDFSPGGLFSLVLTSPDGITWTKRDMSAFTSNYLRAVTWTGARFVACGSSDKILTSPDGATWSIHSAGATAIINGLLWTGSDLFAFGAGGLILKSDLAAPESDPSHWIVSAPGGSPPAYFGLAQHDVQVGFDVVHRIVAVGTGGAIAYSDDDGITGTDISPFISSNLTAVTVTDHATMRFVAVSDNGTVISSSNGTAWDLGGTFFGGSIAMHDVAWLDFEEPMVFAVGHTGHIIVGVDSLPPGVWTWLTGFIGDGTTLHGIAYGKVGSGGLAVAVGDTGRILTSPDGGTWTPRSSGIIDPLYDVTPADINGEGGFVAVGGSGAVVVSKDGVNWDSTHIGVDPLHAVTYTGSQYVTVGWGGQIFTSPDASTWTRRYGATSNTLWAILCSTSGRLLASGNPGVIEYSDAAPDFADWMASQSPPPGMDGPEDDPNSDGIDNLTAYGFGIPAVAPPTSDDLVRLLRWADADPGEPIRLSLVPNSSSVPDVVYILESSPDLAAGSWTGIFRHVPGQECGTGNVHVHSYATGFTDIEIPEPTDSMTAGFYRIRLEFAP